MATDASALGKFVSIDVEGSRCTDVTLEVFRRLMDGAAEHWCLFAGVRRTRQDLESLLPLVAAIRLVKEPTTAYDEPLSIASQRKREVDEQFVELA